MKRILYVEDNPDTNEAVKLILSHAGFEVDTALDGTTGITMASSNKYDLILLDVKLPDMSGWDIFAKLKGKLSSKYAFLSGIPVSTERLDHLAKEGVSAYIMKPFVKEEMIDKITKILV